MSAFLPTGLASGWPCPRCDLMALFRYPDDQTACGACGHVLTAAEFERWTAICAANPRTAGSTQTEESG